MATFLRISWSSLKALLRAFLWQGSRHEGTYAGNVIACAAANATLEIMMAPGFLEGVNARGEQLRRSLQRLQEQHPEVIQEVRGPGLMIGLEFHQVPKGFAQQVVKACLARGLIVLPTGIFETLRIIPPLTVSEEECDKGVSILKDAIEACINASE